MKNLFKVAGIIFLSIFFFVVIGIASYGWQWFTAPFKGKLEKRKEVQSGDFRKYSYEHFYDMYAQIKSYNQQIKAQKQNLKNTQDKERKQKIRQNIVGLQSQRSRLIQQYNADARKTKTSGQFRSNDLPRKIDPEELESLE